MITDIESDLEKLSKLIVLIKWAESTLKVLKTTVEKHEQLYMFIAWGSTVTRESAHQYLEVDTIKVVIARNDFSIDNSLAFCLETNGRMDFDAGFVEVQKYASIETMIESIDYYASLKDEKDFNIGSFSY